MARWAELAAGAVPVALVVRLGGVALALALARRPRASRLAAFCGSAVASSLTGAAALAVVWSGQAAGGVLLRHGASGTSFAYSLPPLSAWFLLVLALLAVPIAVYSLGYLRHGTLATRSPFLGVGFNVLLGAVEMVLVADGVVGFLFAWELMTLATAALVATEHESRQSRRAAFTYLVMSHVGTGCLVAGFLVLASFSGSFAFADALSGPLPPGGARDTLFVLFFIGFGVKAGIVPLHTWLPEAHPAAPTSISALMSAVLINTGIYGLLRVCAFGLGAPRWDWGLALALLGALTAILGVLYALTETDIKRLLAYSTIENAGIMLLGLGAGMMAVSAGRPQLAAVGLAASLLHVMNHALFKGLLFLGAGGVVTATGTRHLEQMGGLARRMPWTALCFLVGAAAISGLPLLNGFVSEWLLFQSFLFGFHRSSDALVHFLFPVAGALLALTTALAAACFVKAFGITFLALPRSPGAENARESPKLMLFPQALLAALCLAIGLAPGIPLRLLQGVVASLPGVQPAPEMVRSWLAVAP